MLASLSLRQYKQLSSGLHSFPHSPTVLLTRVPCSVCVEPTSTTLSTLHWRSICDILLETCHLAVDPTDLVERTEWCDLAAAVEFGIDVVFEHSERDLLLFVGIAFDNPTLFSH